MPAGAGRGGFAPRGGYGGFAPRGGFAAGGPRTTTCYKCGGANHFGKSVHAFSGILISRMRESMY